MSDIFKSSLHVVNVGLEVFYDDLTEQKVDAVHVAWKAPMISEKAQS